jgi:V/A-type H+-transporting ATPase subunit I
MKRLTLIAHKDRLDELIKKLVRLRCVEISSEDDSALSELELGRLNCDARRLELEGKLSDITSAINILDPFVKRSKGLFPQKTRVDTESFISKGHAARAERAVGEAIEAESRLNAIKSERAKCDADIMAATPYLSYDMPLGFSGTEYADSFIGAFPAATDMEECGKELYRAGAILELILSDKNGIYAAVTCHKNDGAQVTLVLSSFGFLKASFAGVKLSASECIKDAQRKKRKLLSEEEGLKDRLRELSKQIYALEVLYDIYATELVGVEQKLKLAATDSAVIIKGWIPVNREAAVVGYLDSTECAYEVSEPTDEEIPPILLQNNGFASNFEWVLGMYSYPVYGRFDPTFIMSIFYFLIFGIMFADAGYGLLLVLGCFGAVKFMHPSDSMKRSLKMFGYCGFSSIIFGVLFGAYFGDLPLAIMTNMMGIPADELPNLALLSTSGKANVAMLFDPIQEPMAFLIVSLGVGALHLLTGMAVQFYIMCKDGHPIAALLDIGTYWVLFGGFALLVVLPDIGLWVALGAALLIVLTHGRGEKSLIMKLMKGLLGLYDLINYVADLLSYSRILALGLASAIIAQVINILGTMGGVSVVGFIAFVVALVIGHLLNLAINVLGTFVHTSRLQYIEFFGKFYEDGGVPFEPAEPSERYSQQINE